MVSARAALSENWLNTLTFGLPFPVILSIAEAADQNGRQLSRLWSKPGCLRSCLYARRGAIQWVQHTRRMGISVGEVTSTGWRSTNCSSARSTPCPARWHTHRAPRTAALAAPHGCLPGFRTSRSASNDRAARLSHPQYPQGARRRHARRCRRAIADEHGPVRASRARCLRAGGQAGNASYTAVSGACERRSKSALF